jgi:hypothetical protein
MEGDLHTRCHLHEYRQALLVDGSFRSEASHNNAIHTKGLAHFNVC